MFVYPGNAHVHVPQNTSPSVCLPQLPKVSVRKDISFIFLLVVATQKITSFNPPSLFKEREYPSGSLPKQHAYLDQGGYATLLVHQTDECVLEIVALLCASNLSRFKVGCHPMITPISTGFESRLLLIRLSNSKNTQSIQLLNFHSRF